MKRYAEHFDLAGPYEYVLYCTTRKYTERLLFNSNEYRHVKKFLILRRFLNLTLRSIPDLELVQLPPELSNL